VRVLFATAELAPLVRVGGLAEAAGGLVQALRRAGVTVDLVVPDYAGPQTVLVDQTTESLRVPAWAGPASARTGELEGYGQITLVDVPGMLRPHPYVPPGESDGWADNDHRFFAYSAAVAALAQARKVDVLHVNDWHAAAAVGLVDASIPTVCSIHNLAYQGWCDRRWLDVLRADRRRAYDRGPSCNPLAGAIALADRVVAVSPRYADEIRTEAEGAGLDELLASRGDALVGILNGIDTEAWDPYTDATLPMRYRHREAVGAKATNAIALRSELGLALSTGPVIAMVTRLVGQKGVDLALDATVALPSLNAQFVLLGAGEPAVAAAARTVEHYIPDQFRFVEGFDLGLAHRMFGASDIFLMPSRFEPCGLAQMQAMRYGSLPVVTDVGGLHDTVLDADANPADGNGFVSRGVSAAGVVDALHRAVRTWQVKGRRTALIKNAMSIDWSWDRPAQDYVELYEGVLR
jgi:starch synthase